MTHLSARRSLAAGTLQVLLCPIAAACSSGTSKAAGTPSTATPPTASGSSTGGTATGSTAVAQGCRSTTSGTGGAGGGDILVPGDIPDTQRFVPFHSPDGYHFDYPEGWAQSQAGSVVTFTDKFNSVRAELTSPPGAPTVASAQAGDVAALAASAPCFQAGKVTQVTRKGGTAILITYRADSPPDPVTGKIVQQDVERYEFWQSGKQFNITLSSSRGSDNVDPWRKVTDSFAWSA